MKGKGGKKPEADGKGKGKAAKGAAPAPGGQGEESRYLMFFHRILVFADLTDSVAY